MIVLIPPGAGYDEEDHLVRVWELSGFSFIPGQLSPQEMKYPTVFRDFAYRQQGSAGIITSNFWQTYTRASLYERGFVHREIDTKSVYSPVLLFPQAVAMRFGRSVGMPALTLFFLCRLASLLSYLILVWIAIRLIPFGKWILLVLALVPMALFQAATVTPDAISNGIGFLFIAGCLRTAEAPVVDWRETRKLILLIFLLFLAKLNLVPLVLLPFLIATPKRFTQKRMYVFLLAITVLFFLVEVAGWNMIAAAHSNSLLANDANPKLQLLYILNHPFFFVVTIFKDLIVNGWMYLQTWINGYGYYYWTPPAVVLFFFALSLVAILWIDSPREQLNQRSRIAFLLIFIVGYLTTAASLYLTFTPVGSDQILGVQGRYFIPLALLLFLALSSLLRKVSLPRPSPRWVTGFLAIALSLNTFGIYLSFHVPCGSTFYQTGLCYRPLSKDLTKTRLSPPLSRDLSLTQGFRAKCDGLTEVRVLLNPSIPGDQGITRFILQNAASNQTLLDTSIGNNIITNADWYSFHFNPDWHSIGKQYILQMSSQDTTPGQGLKLLYTTQSEFDSGDLLENRNLQQEDLVLQYGCLTGLRKIWLAGKP